MKPLELLFDLNANPTKIKEIFISGFYKRYKWPILIEVVGRMDATQLNELKDIKIPNKYVIQLFYFSIRNQNKYLCEWLILNHNCVLTYILDKKNRIKYKFNGENFEMMLNLLKTKMDAGLIKPIANLVDQYSAYNHDFFYFLFCMETNQKHWLYSELQLNKSIRILSSSEVEFFNTFNSFDEFLEKTIGGHSKKLTKLFYNAQLVDKINICLLIAVFAKIYPNLDYIVALIDYFNESKKNKGNNNKVSFDATHAYAMMEWAIDDKKNKILTQRFEKLFSFKKFKNLLRRSDNAVFDDSPDWIITNPWLTSAELVDIFGMIASLRKRSFAELLSKKSYINSLMALHDLCIHIKNKEKVVKRRFLFPKFQEIINHLQSFEEFEIRFPKNNYDLIDWGNSLNNCIGTAEYSEMALKNKILLMGLFLEGELMYTAEVNLKGKVLQCEGKYRKEFIKLKELEQQIAKILRGSK